MTTVNEIMALADAYASAIGELENENWTNGTVGGGSVEYVDETLAALHAAVEKMAQELEQERTDYKSKCAELEVAWGAHDALKQELEAANEVIADRTKDVQYLQAKLDALEPDAAKYHALRDSGYLAPEKFDEEVTKAMTAAGAAQKELQP